MNENNEGLKGKEEGKNGFHKQWFEQSENLRLIT